jgi:hypothetical protein
MPVDQETQALFEKLLASGNALLAEFAREKRCGKTVPRHSDDLTFVEALRKSRGETDTAAVEYATAAARFREALRVHRSKMVNR